MNSHSTNNTHEERDSDFIVPKNKQSNVVEGSVRLRNQINNLEFRQNFFVMKLKKTSGDEEPVVVHAKKMRENKRRKKEEIDSYDNKEEEKRETKRGDTKAIIEETKTTPHQQTETTGSYLPFLSLPLKPICVDEFVAELIEHGFQLVPDHCLQIKNKSKQ